MNEYKNMELKKNNDIRCVVCGAEFNDYELKKLHIKDCPNCHTQLNPMLISQDGYIKINWQELRVLVAYASRWITRFDTKIKGNEDMIKALGSTIAKLEKYRPKTGVPLFTKKDLEIGKKALPIKSPYFKK